MDQARVDWPGATLIEYYRWFIVDERSGKRRLRRYAMTSEEAAER